MVYLENSSQTLKKALDLLNNREEKKEGDLNFSFGKATYIETSGEFIVKWVRRNLQRVY